MTPGGKVLSLESILPDESKKPHGFNVISSYLARFELTRLRYALWHYTKCYSVSWVTKKFSWVTKTRDARAERRDDLFR